MSAVVIAGIFVISIICIGIMAMCIQVIIKGDV
jgi:hypothetical protein